MQTSTESFRPIHYLGSKLRILDAIEEAIDDLDPTMGRVCDLFSGSATVALHLSKQRPVIASDIQEFSRVLASALLQPPQITPSSTDIWFQAVDSKLFTKLSGAFGELLEYEDNAIHAARGGFPEELLEIIENGSVIAFMSEDSKCSSEFGNAMGKAVDGLAKHGIADSICSLVTRHFGGLYLSYKQAIEVDCLLSVVDQTKNQRERDFLLAVVLSVLSQEVNTIGKQFAQPLKVRDSAGAYKHKLGEKALKDREIDTQKCFMGQFKLFEGAKTQHLNNQVFRSDYRDLLKKIRNGDVSAIYADPPYSRYHYSRYYHVLETIALRDNPEVSSNPATGKMSRGVYRKDRHQSPFSIKSQSYRAFQELFGLSASLDCPLVLSYSPYPINMPATPRMITIDKLVQCAQCYYGKVETRPITTFLHSKLNSSDKNFSAVELSELLVLCSNPKEQ
jgi:adenine-specific DNA methylase